MSKFIMNAVSGNMFDLTKAFDLCWKPLSLNDVKKLLKQGGWKSVLGHDDIANLLSEMTDCKLEKNRVNNTLEYGDVAILAQYRGPRLEEGATKLPKDATIQFALVYPAEHISRQHIGNGEMLKG